MKKILILLISFLLVVNFTGKNRSLAASLPTDPKASVVHSAPETDRVIVKLKPTAKGNSLAEYHIENNSLGKNKKLMTVEVPKEQSTKDFIKELQKKDDVVFAEPDYIVKQNYIPNDPSYALQWHHQKIKAETAWNKSKGSKDIVVAVIDNGIDAAHPDLKDNIISTYNAVTDSVSDITAGEHGTHVAGIVASSMDNGVGGTGVAPNTGIMAIDVFTGESAYTSDIIKGIYYAADNGADIINMSLGNYNYSDSFNEAIQYAYQRGLLIVAAAGNESVDSKHYPSAYDNVISVSSTNSNDGFSNFSDYGSDIDLAAPGENIVSSLPGGTYGAMSGTSMASPVVAGVAALIWASEPNLTNTEVAERLYESADDLGSPGKDNFYGYGRVNAKNALNIKDINKPVVNPVSDMDTELTGSISDVLDGGKIAVSNESGEEIGSAALTADVNFTISIPKQMAGTKLTVRAYDAYGTEGPGTEVMVEDKTAPEPPRIFEVTNQSTSVKGIAESNATVTVQIGSESIEGPVDQWGNFEVPITLQKADYFKDRSSIVPLVGI